VANRKFFAVAVMCAALGWGALTPASAGADTSGGLSVDAAQPRVKPATESREHSSRWEWSAADRLKRARHRSLAFPSLTRHYALKKRAAARYPTDLRQMSALDGPWDRWCG
jgi:hypothetical protein